MEPQENAKKLLELSLHTSSSSSEDGRSRPGTEPPPEERDLFSPIGKTEYEVSWAKELEKVRAQEQPKTLLVTSEITGQSFHRKSPTEQNGGNMPRATDSPSISDNLSDTPSEIQRKIRLGESVSAMELAQENDRLKALLAESRRNIDLEKMKSRDMEIQLIETRNQREMLSEQPRARVSERPEGSRIRGQGPGRVSFSDRSPGRLSEGSRHSAGSRHDGSYYQTS